MDYKTVLSAALLDYDAYVSTQIAAALDPEGHDEELACCDPGLDSLLQEVYADQQARRLERIESAQRTRRALRSSIALLSAHESKLRSSA